MMEQQETYDFLADKRNRACDLAFAVLVGDTFSHVIFGENSNGGV